MLQKLTSSTNSGNTSKEQKQFHALLEKIEALKKLIEEKKHLSSKISQLKNEHVLPLLNQLCAVKLAQIRALHWAYERNTLPKRLRVRLRYDIVDRINELLANFSYDKDQEKEIISILAHHSGTSEEELKVEKKEREDEAIREYLRQHYEIELEDDKPADLNDPEIVAKIKAKIAEKTKTQKNQQWSTEDEHQTVKSKGLQEKLSKSIRSVYTSLVKHLHPDKEMNEDKKALKTEAIKEVTQAYESKDMLTLLILQAKYGIVEEGIDDNDLRNYNTILKKQAADLEKQHSAMLTDSYGIPMHSEKAIEKFLKSEKSNLKKHIRQEQGLLQSVFEDEYMLTEYLKQGY